MGSRAVGRLGRVERPGSMIDLGMEMVIFEGVRVRVRGMSTVDRVQMLVLVEYLLCRRDHDHAVTCFGCPGRESSFLR